MRNQSNKAADHKGARENETLLLCQGPVGDVSAKEIKRNDQIATQWMVLKNSFPHVESVVPVISQQVRVHYRIEADNESGGG